MKKFGWIMVVLLGIAIISQVTAHGQSQCFTRPFAPHEGKVPAIEHPYRGEICLNGLWQFMPVDCNAQNGIVPELSQPKDEKWEQIPIRIPSPWNVNSFGQCPESPGGDFVCFPSYPKAWNNVKSAWMCKTVFVPNDWKKNRIVLCFNAVAGRAIVMVNRKKVGENFEFFLPFEFDITPYVKCGQQNEILVGVQHGSLFDFRGTDPNSKTGCTGSRPYLAGSFWGWHIAGIWQDVYMRAVPRVCVADVFIKPMVDANMLEADVTIENDSNTTVVLDVTAQIQPWINRVGSNVLTAPEPNYVLGKTVLSLSYQNLQIKANATATFTLRKNVSGQLKLWSFENPNLYAALFSLAGEGKTVDCAYQRFGWRQFKIEGKNLLLNGVPIRLKGDAWHFMGVPQMTRRYAWAWFTMLKENGGNAVRPHAQPYPDFYLDVADELGIAILDESAMWYSDGASNLDSPIYFKRADEHLKRFVLRDRNHPSVFGWSVCNEMIPVFREIWRAPKEFEERSKDHMTNWLRICNALDPTRQWVSGDGELDAGGRLPVSILHYGDDQALRQLAKGQKIWGIGEGGMGYYGTPKQTSVYNGNRSYESMQGRMEALAFEAYDLIDKQLKYGAAFTGVFNVVWYSLQPLELGMRDTSRPPTLKDGIFFPEFVEGKPGMQPERLGPYCTTLNPGYDPAIPLYRPWPMLEAVRDAYTGKTDSRWAKRPVLEKNEYKKPVDCGVAGFIAGPNSVLERNLRLLNAKIDRSMPFTDRRIVIVDAQSPPVNKGEAAKIIKDLLQQNKTILIWGISADNVNWVNSTIPDKIEITDRKASSLLVCQTSPVVTGIDNAMLYFCEGSRNIMSAGLARTTC